MLFVKLGLMEIAKTPNLPEHVQNLIQALDGYVTAKAADQILAITVAQQSSLIGNHGYQMRWLSVANESTSWSSKCANG